MTGGSVPLARLNFASSFVGDSQVLDFIEELLAPVDQGLGIGILLQVDFFCGSFVRHDLFKLTTTSGSL